MKRLARSFSFAWNGIKKCFSSEPNFRIHSMLGIAVLMAAFIFHLSFYEWIAVIFFIAFVISMEMLNTAIEKLCDVVHKEIHPGIKAVKDMAAGAVLVAATGSVITGCIIFLPKILTLFKTI